jgi:DNA-binding MarR family transcriptional regulator
MRPAEEIRFLILAAQREGNRQLAQALRPLGVTPAQAEVLRLLADRQPLTLTGLGELLVCESGTNPSRLVDRMVVAGLVSRAEAGHDRRHVELTLTEAGGRIAAEIARIEKLLYEILEDVGKGHDLDDVRAYLRALVAGQPAGLAVQRRIGGSADESGGSGTHPARK